MEKKIRTMKPGIDCSSPKRRPHQSRYYGDGLARQAQAKQEQDEYNYAFYQKLTNVYQSPSPYNQNRVKPKQPVPKPNRNESLRLKQEINTEYVEALQQQSPRYKLDQLSPARLYSPQRHLRYKPEIKATISRQKLESDYLKNQKVALQKCLFKPTLYGLVEAQQLIEDNDRNKLTFDAKAAEKRQEEKKRRMIEEPDF